MTDNRKEDEILSNFTQFFGRLSEAFQPKDSYEIYRDKAKSAQNQEDALSFMYKSVSEAKKMISKNTFDNLNIRGNLASLLINEKRYDDFEKLISNYW